MEGFAPPHGHAGAAHLTGAGDFPSFVYDEAPDAGTGRLLVPDAVDLAAGASEAIN